MAQIGLVGRKNVPAPTCNQCTQNKTQDDLERHHWISVAAYYRAEHSGGLPGKELDDWLEAGLDYLKMEIKSCILRCREDGMLNSLGHKRPFVLSCWSSPVTICLNTRVPPGADGQHSPCLRLLFPF